MVAAQLDELYARLPAPECRGLCAHSCHEHVNASTAELLRIRGRGVDLEAGTEDGSCPALHRTVWGTGRCTVHDVRPMICRLWGAAAAMPCPHGCLPPHALLNDTTTLRAMIDSLDTGGWDSSIAPIRDLLDRAMADPTRAALMARYLRGDHTSAPELQHRLRDAARTQG